MQLQEVRSWTGSPSLVGDPDGPEVLALREEPPHLAHHAPQLVRPAGDPRMGRAQARVVRLLGLGRDVARLLGRAVGPLGVYSLG